VLVVDRRDGPTSTPDAAAVNPCTTADPLAGCGETEYCGTGPTVLILGDSITHHSREELRQTLTGHSVRTNGWVGSTIGLNLQYISAMADPQPDIVVVNLGTNDAWQGLPVDQSVADLDGLVATYPDACHVLTTITTQGEESYDRDVAADLNDAIPRRADVVVDWEAARTQDPGLLDTDGIYPTLAGRERLAELVATALDGCPASAGR
jgi:hypothetical protein